MFETLPKLNGVSNELQFNLIVNVECIVFKYLFKLINGLIKYIHTRTIEIFRKTLFLN